MTRAGRRAAGPSRSARARRRGRRLGVALVGGGLVLLGVALVVLPGPFTLPPVLAGLTLLAKQYTWAARLRDRIHRDARHCASLLRRRCAPDE